MRPERNARRKISGESVLAFRLAVALSWLLQSGVAEMSSRTFLILIVCFASIALADDFKTINGKEYKNATVSRIEPDGIVIRFSGGIVKLAFTELSPELQKQYHFNPQAAADFQRQISDAQTKEQPATGSQLQQSGGFRVEPIDARYGAYKLTYKSAGELATTK